MRPIHLAGGRQRDLYGPVISHRSSICIFMVLSSYKGVGGGVGRNRRSGQREKGGGLPTLPKFTISPRRGFSLVPLKVPNFPPVPVVVLGQEGW